MFSFYEIYCHSMEYFHAVKIVSFDKKYLYRLKCHVVLVRPGRIGQKFAPKMVGLSLTGLFCCRTLSQLFHSFTQLYKNGFEPVNNLFRGETSVGVYAVEYQ